MILFEIPLSPRLDGTEELYFRSENEGRDIDLETFFGALSIEKIRKFTDISSIGFNAEAAGELEIEICTETACLLQKNICGNETVTINISDIPENAKLLYPIIHKKNNSGKIEKITVSAACEMVSEVNCALITCTYKREDLIKKNIIYLSEQIKNIPEINCKIIVVDNARTLSENDFPEDVTLVHNINSGGSGGYKKGMEIACQTGKYTHFLLIDDDVEIDFSAIHRTITFLKCLRPEFSDISIAGSMLYMDKPTRQFEAGGYFDKTKGSQYGYGHFLDLADKQSLIKNQEINDINYGGWWYMLMPSKYAYEGNFPLPFFMKYDDVEYALRCRQKIITLNGVGIWHEKFESKYNSSSEYYNTRNYLHLCKLYLKDFTDADAKKIAKKRAEEKCAKQQYKMAKAIMKGYKDFLKGLKWLDELDHEANHIRISELNYKFIPYDEIKKKYGVRPEDNTFYPCPQRRKIISLLIPKKFVFTDFFYDHPSQYIMALYAVHCDSDNNCGYVTKKLLKGDEK